MKILHIVPSIRTGGVVSVLYNLVRSQRADNDDVTIYVSRSQLKFRRKEALFTSIGVRLCYSNFSYLYDPRHICEVRKLMRQTDVVHVHLFPNQLWASLAYRTLPRRERPIMLTTEHSTYNNRRRYPFLRHFDRFLYSPYDRIVSISSQTKTNLDAWLKSDRLSEKSIVIMNGVDIEAVRKTEKADRSLLGIPASAKVVTMVARMEEPKDPVTLLEAVRLCDSSVHVLFVGDGPLLRELEEKASSYGIAERVHLLGLRDDVPSLIKASDLGVLSTKWDGFGMVAVEYMAAGIPVLATDVDGLNDVVGNPECLFKVGDFNTLAFLIDSILADGRRYRGLVNFFEKRCEGFSMDAANLKYRELLRMLCSEKSLKQ